MIRTLQGNAIVRSIAGVGGAAALSQLLMLLIAPVLTRIFSQEELGSFALLVGLANILAVIALLGLSETIVAPRDIRDARGVFVAGSLISALLAVPLAALTLLLVATNTMGYGLLPGWTAPFMLGYLIVLCGSLLAQLWLVRSQRFGALAGSYLVLGGSRAVLQIGFGVAGLGAFGLALGDLLSRLASWFWMLWRSRPDIPGLIATPIISALGTVWRFRIFPITRTPAALANNIGTALPPILVAWQYDLRTTGLFALMTMVLAAPVGLLHKAVGDVFLGHFARRFEDSPEAGRRLMYQTGAFLLPIAGTTGAVLYFTAPQLFGLLFGDDWARAGEFARLMIPLLVLEMIVAPLGGVFLVTHRPDAKLYVDLLRIGGFLAAYLLAKAAEAPAEAMVSYFGWFGFGCYAFYAALELHCVYFPRAAPPAHAAPPTPSTGAI